MKMEKVTMWVACHSFSNFMIICPILKNIISIIFDNFFLLKWILRFKCQFLHMGLLSGNYTVKNVFLKFHMLTSNGIVTWSFGSRSIAAFIATLALEFPKHKIGRLFHWGDSAVGDLKLAKFLRCWWHLLNVGARRLCKTIVDLGDQNGRNRHQHPVSKIGHQHRCHLSLEMFLPDQHLLAIPFDTSQAKTFRAFSPASSDPSNTWPKPPFITSPQPTPPPLCSATHVAPLDASPMQFWTAISAVGAEPS